MVAIRICEGWTRTFTKFATRGRFIADRVVDGESEASKFERNVSFHSSSRSRSRDRSLTCHPELVMSASSSPTKADSNIGRSTNRKREAGNKRLPLFGSDTLILQNRQRQAPERKDNAGRYCAQLSEANRAVCPTRVHRHVITLASPSCNIVILRFESKGRAPAARCGTA